MTLMREQLEKDGRKGISEGEDSAKQAEFNGCWVSGVVGVGALEGRN